MSTARMVQFVTRDLEDVISVDVVGLLTFATISPNTTQLRRPRMAPRDFEELECERFLRTFETSDNPTWGFYVYGTYKRPQEGKETVSENSNAPEAAGRI